MSKFTSTDLARRQRPLISGMGIDDHAHWLTWHGHWLLSSYFPWMHGLMCQLSVYCFRVEAVGVSDGHICFITACVSIVPNKLNMCAIHCTIRQHQDEPVDLQGMQPRRKHKVSLPRNQIPICTEQVQPHQAISIRCALHFSKPLLQALPSCACSSHLQYSGH